MNDAEVIKAGFDAAAAQRESHRALDAESSDLESYKKLLLSVRDSEFQIEEMFDDKFQTVFGLGGKALSLLSGGHKHTKSAMQVLSVFGLVFTAAAQVNRKDGSLEKAHRSLERIHEQMRELEAKHPDKTRKIRDGLLELDKRPEEPLKELAGPKPPQIIGA